MSRSKPSEPIQDLCQDSTFKILDFFFSLSMQIIFGIKVLFVIVYFSIFVARFTGFSKEINTRYWIENNYLPFN